MGVIEYPDGKRLSTREGDRYEATQNLVLDVNGREVRLRAGDMLTIEKADPHKKIMQIP